MSLKSLWRQWNWPRIWDLRRDRSSSRSSFIIQLFGRCSLTCLVLFTCLFSFKQDACLKRGMLVIFVIYLCLPSFSQFLVTLVIHWRIYCLPYHSTVPFSVLPDGEDLEFWRSYLRIHFHYWWIPLLQLSIITYWLTNCWILSMFDFSLPLFTWLGLYWFFGILYEDLSSHLWTKLRKIMFYPST